MKRLIFLCLFLITFYNTKGQNIGGEIIFKKTSSPYTYDFTLAKYTSYPSINNLSSVSISMGDGIILQINRTDSLILHNNILLSNYNAIYTYPMVVDDLFVIYYEDSTNNTFGINYPNSSQFPFYLQSALVINPFLGINNSVYFADKPIMLGDINKPLKQNITAIDIDGDSLSFMLIDLDGADSNKYWIPSTMTINPINGEISWSNPQQIGKYAFGVLVSEWRYGAQVGFVQRRFQIKIDTLNSTNHFIINNWNTNFNGDYEYHITPNTNLQLSLCYSDSLADSLKLNAYGDVFIINNPAIFNDSLLQYNIYGLFHWTPDTFNIRNNPYTVTFRGSSYVNASLIEQDVTVMIYVDNSALINEINNIENNIKIFPNPSGGYYTLQFAGGRNEIAEFTVFNILGKEVYFEKLKTTAGINHTHIDLSGLSDGIYFLRAKIDENLYSAKIIKQ